MPSTENPRRSERGLRACRLQWRSRARRELSYDALQTAHVISIAMSEMEAGEEPGPIVLIASDSVRSPGGAEGALSSKDARRVVLTCLDPQVEILGRPWPSVNAERRTRRSPETWLQRRVTTKAARGSLRSRSSWLTSTNVPVSSSNTPWLRAAIEYSSRLRSHVSRARSSRGTLSQ
jgi:hypothetical protein